MRIALLINFGNPWARDTAQELMRLGHEIHVIDFTTNKAALGHLLREDAFQAAAIRRFTESVTQVHWLRSAFRNNIRYVSTAPSFRLLLQRINPDALLTLYSGGFATLAQLSGWRPYFTWVVGSDVLLAKGLARRIQRSALKSASLVLANGETLTAATRQLAPEANVENLLLGIDPAVFPRGAEGRGPVLILTNRGFNPIYQNDLIVRALGQLKTTQTFEFIFASAGPELQRVKALADQVLPPTIKAQVSFAGGVTRERMLELLGRARYFVSMARSDGTATSLLEAMASGVYPIVSDIPQNREWVKPEWKNGSLVPVDKPHLLSRTLEQLLQSSPDHSVATAFNRNQVELRADSRKNLERLCTKLIALKNSASKCS